MCWRTTTCANWLVPWIALLLSLLIAMDVRAARTYSPNEVFSGVEYANSLLDRILATKGLSVGEPPRSREQDAKPMHVYELHVSAIMELYAYSLANDRRPPPLVISTPIDYKPTDVYYLTKLVIDALDEIHADGGRSGDLLLQPHTGKSPSDVYQEVFELYYKLSRLNAKTNVSPDEVYSHILRAREDLQYSLLTLSKQLPSELESKKRMLVTAIYGMHPDGTTLSAREDGVKPTDVLAKALSVRAKLNALRKKNDLSEIKRPEATEFGSVQPIDVFLQTQFIIAELNLLKDPLGIHSTTNPAKSVSGKTPSDVYQEMKHIEYMLDRLTIAL